MRTSAVSLARRIERWSLVNAIGVLGATALAGWIGHLWPVLVMGAGSLGGLVVVAREGWTPTGSFGAANTVTALRLGLLAMLPAFSGRPAWVLTLSGGILVADALDGWLARRAERTSTFGAFFDKETDALFLLVLCMMAVVQGRVPDWVLGAGLLRYLFVVAVFGLDPPEKTEPRFNWARYIYGATVAALLLSFLPYPGLARPAVQLASAALVASFAWSFWTVATR